MGIYWVLAFSYAVVSQGVQARRHTTRWRYCWYLGACSGGTVEAQLHVAFRAGISMYYVYGVRLSTTSLQDDPSAES